MGKNKKGKLVTKAKYLPIQTLLNSHVAYAQAAFALDCAVQAAEREGNAEQLSTASALWMELGDRLGGRSESTAPTADITSQKIQFGFSGTAEDEYAEPGDES